MNMPHSTDFLTSILASKKNAPPESLTLPTQRVLPLLPFCARGGLICEVKRHSPSKGSIKEHLNPIAQATLYKEQGAAAVSVLTESKYFHGSLSDLIAIKQALPDLALLRKDFILDGEEVLRSWQAGADAILLIAAILETETLRRLKKRAEALGMAALLEIHSQDDVEKVRPLAPAYTGVNARDLQSFNIDLLSPLMRAPHIDWPTTKIFESGIQSRAESMLARAASYDAILVGEGAVRFPERIKDIGEPFQKEASGGTFWNRIAALLDSRRSQSEFIRPLVKICGITNTEDAELAVHLGADILGFVFAASPRRASASLLRDLATLPVLKVAVVETEENQTSLPQELQLLWDEGCIDALQFHGAESQSLCEAHFPFFRAYNPASPAELEAIRDSRCPRVLIDAHVKGMKGGTGKRVASSIVDAARSRFPLWLAGGLNPDNISETVKTFHPELIDLSSGVERSPGKKDAEKLRRLFTEIARSCKVERSLS